MGPPLAYSTPKSAAKLSSYGLVRTWSLILFYIYSYLAVWYKLLPAALGGIAAADMIAGFVHWLLDNYPAVKPIAAFFLGWPFVRQYEIHHERPDEIIKYSFWETNADGLLATSAVETIVLLSLIGTKFNWVFSTSNISISAQFGVGDAWTSDTLAWLCFWIFYFQWTAFTNQFHKYSHLKEVPTWVRILRACGLMLTVEEHDRHHRNAKVAFCLTTGWCNWFLETIRFWHFLRKIIRFCSSLSLDKLAQWEHNLLYAGTIKLAGQRGFFGFLRDTRVLATQGLHALFADITRRNDDGRPVFAYIIGEPAVFVQDPAQISHVLGQHMDEQKRYEIVARMRTLLGINLVTAPGHMGLDMRMRTLPYLRGASLRKYEQEAMEIIMRDFMTPKWREVMKSGQPLNIWNSMLEYSSLIVFMSFLGLKFNEIPPHIHSLLNEMFCHIRKLILKPIMLPLWVPTSYNRDFKSRMSLVREFVQPYIEKQKEDDTMLGSIVRNFTTRRDVTKEQFEQEMNDKISEEAFARAIKAKTVFNAATELRRQLKGTFTPEQQQKLQVRIESFLVKGGKIDIEAVLQEIVSNLIGGSETTIVFMTFSCYHLANNPDVQTKLRDYLQQAESDKIPLSEQITNGYLGKVLNEVLRLSPPGVVHNRPLDKAPGFWRSFWNFISRKPSAKFSLKLNMRTNHITGKIENDVDYEIPIGAVPWMSQVLAHRDPVSWKDPLKFNPERWDQPTIKGSYFPFGIGDRSCPGDQYARREAAVSVSALIKMCKITLADPNYQLLLEYDVTLRPANPILLTLTPLTEEKEI